MEWFSFMKSTYRSRRRNAFRKRLLKTPEELWGGKLSSKLELALLGAWDAGFNAAAERNLKTMAQLGQIKKVVASENL